MLITRLTSALPASRRTSPCSTATLRVQRRTLRRSRRRLISWLLRRRCRSTSSLLLSSTCDWRRPWDAIRLHAHIRLPSVIINADLHTRVVGFVGTGERNEVRAGVCSRTDNTDLRTLHVELCATCTLRQPYIGRGRRHAEKFTRRNEDYGT
jgi:hypothetical protein